MARAMWGGSAEIDSESLYKASFGEIPDETVYDDGFGKIEMMVDDAGDLVIDNQTLHKAVNVGAASGAAGYALTPIVWDRDVVEFFFTSILLWAFQLDRNFLLYPR